MDTDLGWVVLQGIHVVDQHREQLDEPVLIHLDARKQLLRIRYCAHTSHPCQSNSGCDVFLCYRASSKWSLWLFWVGVNAYNPPVQTRCFRKMTLFRKHDLHCWGRGWREGGLLKDLGKTLSL